MSCEIISMRADSHGNLRTRRLKTHDRSLCVNGEVPCVIHNPSSHHMSAWELNWRDDSGMMERLCPHGIGHPDPDHMAWVLHCDPNASWHGIHGCDGCCIRSADAA